MSKFAAPAPAGDKLPPLELLGHLLVIIPTNYQTGIITKFTKPGASGEDAVVVDVAVLTQTDQAGQIPVYHDAMFFNVGLRLTLKKQLGELVLARMGQGQAKDGQDPPFTLVDATQDASAVAFAEQWLAANPQFEATGLAKARAAGGLAAINSPAAMPAMPTGQVPVPGVPQNAQSRPATAPAVAPVPTAAPAPAGPTVANPWAPTTEFTAAAPAPAAGPMQIDPAVIAALPPDQQAAILALMAKTA